MWIQLIWEEIALSTQPTEVDNASRNDHLVLKRRWNDETRRDGEDRGDRDGHDLRIILRADICINLSLRFHLFSKKAAFLDRHLSWSRMRNTISIICPGTVFDTVIRAAWWIGWVALIAHATIAGGIDGTSLIAPAEAAASRIDGLLRLTYGVLVASSTIARSID